MVRVRFSSSMGKGRAFVVICLVSLGLSWATTVRAELRRVIVAVGSNRGLDAERPLAYAERDAERFAKVMMELGGASVEDVTLLTGATPKRLMQVLVATAQQLSRDAMLIVYYSGHGSESALHMQGERLSIEQLRLAVDRMPASLRLVVIDACRDAVARKGFSQVEPFAISISAAPQHRGMVTMQSSGPGEAALESTRLGSGLFSHYLISGLRGAADRDFDGRISVNEAYEFAYSRTLQQSASAVGRSQHPTIRMDIEGSGPLVLTSVAPTKSLLALPAGSDVHYVVFEKGSQNAFAEAWSRPEHATLVALPAGQFVVQQRSSDGYRVGEVTLPFGGTRQLSQSDFRDSPDEELALRGGEQVLRRNRLSAAFGLTLTEGYLGEGATMSYSRGSNHWQLSAGIGVSRHEYDVSARHVQRNALSALAGAQYTELFERVNARIGVGLVATVHDQELLGGLSRDRDLALGLGPYARAGVSVPLMPWLDWELAMLGLATFFNEDRTNASVTTRRLAVDTSMLLTSGLGVAF